MERLHRLEWVYSDAPVYFVTACTDGRRKILSTDSAHAAFVAFCQNAKSHGVIVGRYVLMPDHLHLFACILPGDATLSGWMKSLKNSLSKHWRAEGIEAPHWQKGFFDHLLRSNESAAEKWHYVRQNPVRAGLCNDPDHWRYAGEIHPLVQH
jgi:putative transposase